MTLPGGYSSGDVLTAADMNALPAGLVGLAERTTSAGLTTTPASIVSTTVNVVSGRKYFLQFFGWTYSTSTSMTVTAIIYFDGNQINAATISANATDDNCNLSVSRVITSSVTGSVTIEARAYTSTGTTFIRGTSTTIPNLICVDVGE